MFLLPNQPGKPADCAAQTDHPANLAVPLCELHKQLLADISPIAYQHYRAELRAFLHPN